MRSKLLMTLLAAAAAATQPLAAQGPGTGTGTTGVSEHVTMPQPGVVVPGSATDAPKVAAGPLLPSWFVGPLVGRNFEREQFFLGLEAGRVFGMEAWGELFGNVQLTRTGQSNGTLWTVAPGVGVLPTSLILSQQLMTRFIASVIYNRISSEFASGSDLGVAFSAGLLYGVNESFLLATDVSGQRVGGFTAVLLTISLLLGSTGSG